MTRVVVIGGSGHVGTYLVPRLVEAGFATTNTKGLSGFTAHVSEHGLVYMPKVYSGTPK